MPRKVAKRRISKRELAALQESLKKFLDGRSLSVVVRPKEEYLQISADGRFIFGVKVPITLDITSDVTAVCSRCKDTKTLMENIVPLLQAVTERVETLPEEMSKTGGKFESAIRHTQQALKDMQVITEKSIGEAESALAEAKGSFSELAELRRTILVLRDKGNKLLERTFGIVMREG